MTDAMRSMIEWEPSRTNKRLGWWRLVTIERNGLRHNLTPWAEDTQARIRQRAKLEGVELVQVQEGA